jgi:hypothetical protein
MYTVLDDRNMAKTVNEYMALNTDCSIKDIMKQCSTTRTRLKSLELHGYFSLPKLTRHDILNRRFKNRSYVSVTVGREHGKWIGY